MKKILYTTIILSTLLTLAWCGSQTPEEQEKQAFFVDAVYMDQLSGTVLVEKIATLLDQQYITVSAQAAGRVSNIPGQAGQDLLSGQPVIQLSDTIASYGIQAERALNNIQRTQAQESQTSLSLEDAVTAAEAALIQARENLRIAEKNQTLSDKWQELALDQTRISTENQLKNIQISYTSEYTTFKTLLSDVLDTTDSILGVTPKYRSDNDWFEILLSAKNTTYKNTAEDQLLKLYITQSQTTGRANTDPQSILTNVDNIINTYTQMQEFLTQMQQVLINSIDDTQISWLPAIITSLQTRVQTAKGAFSTFRTQAISSLSTTQDSTWSLAFTIGQQTAELNAESTRLASENAIINAKLALNTAERNYQQALNNKDKQARVLQTQAQDAQLAYQDALKQLAKLTVWSPVRGILGDILVGPWQDVQVGTPLFTMLATDNQLLQTYISQNELPFVTVGQEVYVIHNNQTITGIVQSVPRVADKNMQYRLTISIADTFETIPTTAKIHIPIKTWLPMLPINIIAGVQNNKGTISLLNNKGEVENKVVTIGKVRGDSVQLMTQIPENYRIILSDISNYNPDDFTIVIPN